MNTAILKAACAKALAHAGVEDFLDEESEGELVMEIVLAAHCAGTAPAPPAVRQALRDQAQAHGIGLAGPSYQ